MPEQEYDPEDFEEGVEEEDDDEGDDQPTAVSCRYDVWQGWRR